MGNPENIRIFGSEIFEKIDFFGFLFFRTGSIPDVFEWSGSAINDAFASLNHWEDSDTPREVDIVVDILMKKHQKSDRKKQKTKI